MFALSQSEKKKRKKKKDQIIQRLPEFTLL